MNITQWLNKATAYLAGRCPGAGRIDAEALLGHCTGRDRAELYRDGLEELPAGLGEEFWRLVERRAGGEPLAYITGRREFMGLEFLVSPAVLIPRQETELLVEKALEILSRGGRNDPGPGPVLADVGTGSGAVAVSLAVLCPKARVYATDISAQALAVAGQNAHRQGVADRVRFLPGDLLGPLLDLPGLKADLVAANLPYVPSGEIPGLMPDVRDFEPGLALDGGPDGLDLYRRLIPQAREILRPGGSLLMEIGPGQGEPLTKALGPGWEAQIIPDLAGRERVVLAYQPPTPNP